MNIILAGVGGQGIVLASKVLANAALVDKRAVRTSETIGMAQRGGTVLGHVRIASKADRASTPYSPLISIGQADLIIAFEMVEALRALPFLKTEGSLITSDMVLLPAGLTKKSQRSALSAAVLAEKLQNLTDAKRLAEFKLIPKS